jgi:predicted heme/steroid binding protein
MQDKTFSLDELARYDGIDGPAYVAYGGKVYDVTRSFLWPKGNHQGLHRAGQDLTEAFSAAPHGVEFLERFPVVGILE